jgi:hypothetical protein
MSGSDMRQVAVDPLVHGRHVQKQREWVLSSSIFCDRIPSIYLIFRIEVSCLSTFNTHLRAQSEKVVGTTLNYVVQQTTTRLVSTFYA